LEHFAELADHINSLMKQGQMLEAIGRSELGRSHVRNILKKLNAANRTHAAFVANRLLGQDAEPVAP
jgi:DNA-binding NarL/FixJ family response regulator